MSPTTAMVAPRLPTAVQGEKENNELKQATDGAPSLPSSTLPVAPGSGNTTPSDSILIIPDHYRGTRPRQKSYAEMANEQLNTGEHRDRLADGIKEAVVPDCMSDSGLLGLPVIIYKAVNGKCK
ncbi:MAG: hypothetical protein IPH37_15950 [Burkholderiales bacterium]|nr:hypothetical protein [Burkholderiales bacterium]